MGKTLTIFLLFVFNYFFSIPENQASQSLDKKEKWIEEQKKNKALWKQEYKNRKEAYIKAYQHMFEEFKKLRWEKFKAYKTGKRFKKPKPEIIPEATPSTPIPPKMPLCPNLITPQKPKTLLPPDDFSDRRDPNFEKELLKIKKST